MKWGKEARKKLMKIEPILAETDNVGEVSAKGIAARMHELYQMLIGKGGCQ